MSRHFKILFIISIFILIILFKVIDPFDGSSGIISSPMDRTKLYGSLFLDNIETVIKNMTDPKIKYDTKRIQVIRYSDVLE